MLKHMKFSANISFMFKEYPFLDRYLHARANGFKGVESGFPLGIAIEDIVGAKQNAQIEQILLNTYTGDVSSGEVGFAALPGKECEFNNSLELTIKYAKALECKKIHVMAGKVDSPITSAHLETYESNLKLAESRFREENIIGLIEPINKYSLPKYFLNSYDRAIDVLKKINSPHLRLMLDIYHMQQIQGNVTRSIQTYIPYIGHIQIAQVPYRTEPNSAGEINYKYVLDLVTHLNYNDWIGLEYNPEYDTVQGLSWINEFSYEL